MYRLFCFIAFLWIGMHPILAQDSSKRQQELEAQRIRFKKGNKADQPIAFYQYQNT